MASDSNYVLNRSNFNVSETALSRLTADLDAIRAKGLMLVVRFCYTKDMICISHRYLVALSLAKAMFEKSTWSLEFWLRPVPVHLMELQVLVVVE